MVGRAESALELWKRSLPQNHGIFNHGIRGNMDKVEGRSEDRLGRAGLRKRRKGWPETKSGKIGSERCLYRRIMAGNVVGAEGKQGAIMCRKICSAEESVKEIRFEEFIAG